MKYERLTNNNYDEYDLEYDFCCDCEYFGEPHGCYRHNGSCDGYERFLETYSRLAELEDKIEAGTLVTVPYAIGQEVYWVDKKGYFDVEKAKVSIITIRHDGSVDTRLNPYNNDGSYRSCFKYNPKYDALFDNEADAKKRLEEIRNGK